MTRKKRILTVAPEPFFSPRGTPLSVYYRTLALSELGVEVDLLTYGEGEEIDLPGVRTLRIPRFRWLGTPKVGPSVLKLFLDLFLVIWAVPLLSRNRYEAVHAHEEGVFFCRYLKPLFGFKLVYEMHSSLPRQLVSFGWSRPAFLVRCFERLERSTLTAADAVVTISPELADYARTSMPDPRRHFLIENSLVEPVRLKHLPDVEATVGEWDSRLPAGVPIIGYAGTFESYQGLDLLIAAFRETRAEIGDGFLLLIGGRPEQVDFYRRMARESGIEEYCLFTGSLPREAARALLRRATVVTSPRKDGTQTPLKIYEILASGQPLVATRTAAHTQVLDDSVCVLCEADADSLAAALTDALVDPERLAHLAANARSLYEERYSRQSYLEKMRRLMESID